MISPIFRRDAKIALVTEASNKQEIELGKLFTGTNGRIMGKALGFANLKLEDCNLLTLSQSSNWTFFYLDVDKTKPSAELSTYWQQLKRNLIYAKVNVVVAVGEEAMFALTGKRGIAKWRGSILPSTLVTGLKVIPTFTTEWIRRGQFQHFWSLVGDLTRAEKQSHFSEIRPPVWQSITSPGHTNVVDFLKGIPEDVVWSLDIETRANHLACLSVAFDNQAMCIPIQNPAGPAYFPIQEAMVWRELQVLMDRNPNLVGQNLTFDLEYLFDYGLEPSGIYMDTMLSHAILYPEFPKGLDFLASLYTEMPYYKSEGKISNPKVTTQDLWTYNNKDTITTLWCAFEIEKQLRKRGLWQVHEFVTSELGIALEMQRKRLLVDQSKKAELKILVKFAQDEIDQKWETRHCEIIRKLAGEAGVRPNVNSSKQVAQFLYGHLNLITRTRDGAVVADETVIAEFKAAHPEHPELGWILEERHLRKLNSSYLDVMLEPDGTIGGSWCVHGTETGRWSSGKSPKGRGMNLQTVPKAIRWMIVPNE